MDYKAQLRAELREFVIDNYLFGQAQSFSDDESFTGSGIIDSTGVLELVSHLEDRYGIEVKDEELLPENLDSLDRLAAYLSGKGVVPVGAGQMAVTPEAARCDHIHVMEAL